MDINLVKQPQRHSEFEVQAYLYSELLRAGFNVFGEVKVSQKSKHAPKEVCRFDIAEFADSRLVGIIEVKADHITHQSSRGWLGTRQGARYTKFQVPVAIVYGIENARDFVIQAAKERRIPYDSWRP